MIIGSRSRMISKALNSMSYYSFIFLTVYLSYRYPFQLNSAGTSPTYSDTPFFLQIAKYIFALVLSLMCFLTPTYFDRQAKIGAQIAITLIAIELISGIKYFVSFDYVYVEALFWIVAAFALSIKSDWTSKQIENFLIFLFIYAMLYEFIEIFLYFYKNRLPALAYHGTYSIRFGSFLDDPNGFGILSFLFLGWGLKSNGYFLRTCILVVVFTMMLATQSLTAIFVLCIFLLFVVLVEDSFPMRITIIGFVLAIFCIGLFVSLRTNFFEELYVSKIRSISEHLQTTTNYDVPTLIYGKKDYYHHESWWYRYLINFGAPAMLLSLFMHISMLGILYNRYKEASDIILSRVNFSIFAFGFAFVLGSFFLPLPVIFPIGFVFYLLAFLVLANRIRTTSSL